MRHAISIAAATSGVILLGLGVFGEPASYLRDAASGWRSPPPVDTASNVRDPAMTSQMDQLQTEVAKLRQALAERGQGGTGDVPADTSRAGQARPVTPQRLAEADVPRKPSPEAAPAASAPAAATPAPVAAMPAPEPKPTDPTATSTAQVQPSLPLPPAPPEPEIVARAEPAPNAAALTPPLPVLPEAKAPIPAEAKSPVPTKADPVVVNVTPSEPPRPPEAATQQASRTEAVHTPPAETRQPVAADKPAGLTETPPAAKPPAPPAAESPAPARTNVARSSAESPPPAPAQPARSQPSPAVAQSPPRQERPPAQANSPTVLALAPPQRVTPRAERLPAQAPADRSAERPPVQVASANPSASPRRSDDDDMNTVLARLRQSVQPPLSASPSAAPAAPAAPPVPPIPPARAAEASVPAPVGRLRAAHGDLAAGRIEAARKQLQQAQLYLVFRPIGDDQGSDAADAGAADVGRALSALGQNDVRSSIAFVERAMGDLQRGQGGQPPAQMPSQRELAGGYAPAYPPR